MLLSVNPFTNPSFEAETGSGTPTGWDGVGKIAAAKALEPAAPDGGNYAVLSTGASSADITLLEAFLGNDGKGDTLQDYYEDAFRGSAISQTVSIPAHHRLSFQWDFVTFEDTSLFFPNNDAAVIWLTGVGTDELASTRGSSFTDLNSGFFAGAVHTGFETYSISFTNPATVNLNAAVFDDQNGLIPSGEEISYLVLDNFQVSADPTPDDFSDAFALSGTSDSVNNYSNLTATKQFGEPDHAGDPGGSSMWWRWTAPRSAQVTIDTIGSGFDTLLAVYTGGPAVFDLTEVASNDDRAPGKTTSLVSFNAIGGTTYYIAVDGKNAEQGSLDLRIDQVEPPKLDVTFGDLTLANGSQYDFGVIPFINDDPMTPELEETPTSLRQFTITNTGEEPLTLNGNDPIRLKEDTVFTHFEIIQQPDMSVLPPGASTEFVVEFLPRFKPEAELWFGTNDPDTPIYTLSLTGGLGIAPTDTFTFGAGDSTFINSTINIPPGVINPFDAVVPRLMFSLTKPGSSHITATLTNPVGTEVVLLDRVVSGDFFETTFGDDGRLFSQGVAPYTGVFQPVGVMATLAPEHDVEHDNGVEITIVSRPEIFPGNWFLNIEVDGPATITMVGLQVDAGFSTPNSNAQLILGVPTPPAEADAFEFDGEYEDASPFSLVDAVQTHSITALGLDADWVTFDLDWTSDVVIHTSGPDADDTELLLYSDPEADPITVNDDGEVLGDGGWSRIEHIGVDALPPGTYYVLVIDFGQDDPILTYDLSITATPHISPDLELINLNAGMELLPGQPVVLPPVQQNGPDSETPLRIENNGNTDLQIDSITISGTGFTLADLPSPFPTNVAPSGSVEFKVVLDSALSPGDYAGTVTITSNDPDEPTRAIQFTGEVIDPAVLSTMRIVGPALDEGADPPGFDVTGVWFRSPSSADVGSPRLVTDGLSGTGEVTWTFASMTPGLYRVSATWDQASNRATDVPFTFFDGLTEVGSVVVDQTQPADDLMDTVVFTGISAERGFEDLGEFGLTGDTLSVQLLSEPRTDGRLVFAQFLRVERIGELPTVSTLGPGFDAATDPPGFDVTGTWSRSTSFNDGVSPRLSHSGTPDTGEVTWTFNSLLPGLYRVSATWDEGSNRVMEAPFTITDGLMLLGSAVVDQTQPADDLVDTVEYDGGSVERAFEDLGVFGLDGGTIQVQLLSEQRADGRLVLAQFVRIERIDDLPETPPAVDTVILGGTGWSEAFYTSLTGAGLGDTHGYYIPEGAAQLDTINWADVDRVSIRFTQPVQPPTLSDLQITGNGAPAPVSVGYDAVTYTATWTLNAPLPDGAFTVNVADTVTNVTGFTLDGEFTDTAMLPSGNGTQGGDFTMTLNVMAGDFTNDGVTNADDIDSLTAAIRTASTGPLFDLTGDGVVDQAGDTTHLVTVILNTAFGDFNLDLVVDLTDLTVLAINFGQAGGWINGDANGDAAIDLTDLTVLAINFGFDNTASQAANAAVVGDLNGDHTVDADDIDLLSSAIRSRSTDTRYDLTGDGVVDKRDKDHLIRDVLNTNYGDANLDGVVDREDYWIMRTNYRVRQAGWSQGDFNGDGWVNYRDMSWYYSSLYPGYTMRLGHRRG